MISQLDLGKIYKYDVFNGLRMYVCPVAIEEKEWDKYVIYHHLSDPERLWRDSIVYVISRWENVSL